VAGLLTLLASSPTAAACGAEQQPASAPPARYGGGPADPTLLPVATKQAPYLRAYEALGVGALKAGGSYLDPATGVTVYRVTDAHTPAGNQRAVPDYADGGPFMSLPWTSGGKTYYTLYLQVRVGSNEHYLVDFNYGDGAFSNWRGAPTGASGELLWSFSSSPATPRIAYYLAGRTLHRYDTEGMTQANIGNFPHTFGIGKDGDWLSVDTNDRWFVCQEKFDGGTIAAWNSQTNVEHRGATAEPHMIRDGSFVMGAEDRASTHENLSGQVVSNTALLNLATGVLTRPDQPESHPAGAANGFFMSVNPHQRGGPQLYRFEAATATQTRLGGRGAIIGGSGHFAGQWVVDNLPGLSMWMLFSGWGSRGLLNNAIAFIPFNATPDNVRLLAHHYSQVTDYYAQPHATVSPDGRLVLFGSDMNASGRIDAFLVKVPTR